MIDVEYWITTVPGASVEHMAARLAEAGGAERIPLALVAVQDDQPIGAINLVENEDKGQPKWSPWRASLVVAAAWRGRSVGPAFVRALLADAERLGTDGPGFHLRLGAVVHELECDVFCVMRVDLQSVTGAAPA